MSAGTSNGVDSIMPGPTVPDSTVPDSTVPDPIVTVVRDLRRRWRVREGVRGALLGVIWGAGVFLSLLFADAVGLVPEGWHGALRWTPLLAALAAWALGFVRVVRAPGDRAWILRMEETHSQLEHIVSAAADARTDDRVGRAIRRRAEAALAMVSPPAVVRLRLRRELGLATASGIALLGLFLASGLTPGDLFASWGDRPPETRATAAPGASVVIHPTDPPDAGSPLDDLWLEVVPPRYSRLPTENLPLDGSEITVLAGSRLTLRGPQRAMEGEIRVQRVTMVASGAATEEGRLRPVAVASDVAPIGAWTAQWVVAPEDRGLSVDWVESEVLRSQRVIPIGIVPDSPPDVELIDPAEDLVLATGNGRVEVRARALDPLGLGAFHLEWVHSRGSGESFAFREGKFEWESVRPLAGGVEGVITLDLSTLDMGPGDVVHLRAAAHDRNDVTGPGEGVSGTRQLRVIRDGEEMQVTALTGFPLEVDRDPILSQRMILLMTEQLAARLPELDRGAVLDESSRIAREQARLRAEVGEQVYSRATGAMQTLERHLGEEGALAVATPTRIGEDGQAPEPAPEPGHAHEPGEEPMPTGGTQVGAVTIEGPGTGPIGFGVLEEFGHAHDSDPVLSVNRELLRISDLMWEAERHLLVGDPVRSIPVQEEALARIQALRESERLFPRGFVQAPPVDVQATRGTGDLDEVDPAPRGSGDALVSAADRVAEIDALAALLPDLPPDEAAREFSALALRFLVDPAIPGDVSALLARSADRLREAVRQGKAPADGPALVSVHELLTEARNRLAPARRFVEGGVGRPLPRSSAGSLDAGSHPSAEQATGSAASPEGQRAADARATPAPFEFVTLRYESGNWDSAPLVPTNLIHSIARYTEIPVAAEGLIVDLSSPELFRHPFVYLTGHLPVRFSAAESENLRRYVERGGFVFLDDHNHDIDGAFHRTAVAELARIFGSEALQPLPNDHELYGTFFPFEDGPPLTSHELSGWGDGLIHPELMAVTVSGRIGVLYSNKDYSSEWNYHAVNKRFLAVDNTRFGVNVILYAMTR